MEKKYSSEAALFLSTLQSQLKKDGEKEFPFIFCRTISREMSLNSGKKVSITRVRELVLEFGQLFETKSKKFTGFLVIGGIPNLES